MSVSLVKHQRGRTASICPSYLDCGSSCPCPGDFLWGDVVSLIHLCHTHCLASLCVPWWLGSLLLFCRHWPKPQGQDRALLCILGLQDSRSFSQHCSFLRSFQASPTASLCSGTEALCSDIHLSPAVSGSSVCPGSHRSSPLWAPCYLFQPPLESAAKLSTLAVSMNFSG